MLAAYCFEVHAAPKFTFCQTFLLIRCIMVCLCCACLKFSLNITKDDISFEIKIDTSGPGFTSDFEIERECGKEGCKKEVEYERTPAPAQAQAQAQAASEAKAAAAAPAAGPAAAAASTTTTAAAGAPGTLLANHS